MRMKKAVLAGLTICLSAFMLTGCGSISDEHVSISKYKGLEVEIEKTDEITDDTVNDEIQSVLEQYAETKTKKGKAESGDTVNIDYVGTVDGEEFDGGSAENYDLELGSGTFIGANGDYKGFEDQLIGCKKGDKVTVTVQFPSDYSEESLQGKVAKFAVKVNKVTESVLPDYNDAWVAELEIEDVTTTDEYFEYTKKNLEDEAASTKESNTQSAVAQALQDNIEVVSIDDDEISELAEEYEEQTKSSVEAYGIDWDTYLSSYAGQTQEEFQEQCKESAEQNLAYKYACKLIAEKEGLELTDEEYESQMAEVEEQTGASLEDLEEYYTKEYLEDYCLQQKVLDYLVEKAKVTEVESTATDSTTESE